MIDVTRVLGSLQADTEPASIFQPITAGTRVGMIDDDPVAMRALSYQLQDVDMTPVEISLAGSPSLDDVLAKLQDNGCAAAVCDHRLRGGGHAQFDGAQLVCQANLSVGLPCILLSSWTAEDEATSIRRWRHGIPKVLSKRGRSPQDLIDALTVTRIEMAGERPLERRPFSTAVEIAELSYEAECQTAHVYVPAWDPDIPVVVPLDLFPIDVSQMPSEEVLGSFFIGKVNYYAREAGELFFRDLRISTLPPADWLPA
ncbi:hypothetical protein [Kitasatospora sp. NPDC057223]|uniref:hypothetical protein n=1 Tax=Kitasatospora sp. NPDC057223 TaxID=3346055 RepID=UPI0036265B7C